MTTWIRQSTARTLVMGPFLDSTDGVTPEIALDITEQEILLSKNGGAFTLKSETTHGVHDAAHNGWYTIPLDTTDTNTLGILTIAINMTGALPVWAEYQVVEEQVWDSFFGSDLLDVNQAQVLGTAVHASSENGTQCVEVVRWGGNDVAATGVNGVPKVDLSHINAAAQTATLDTIKAETVLIVEDTGTTLPASFVTLDAVVDTVKVDTAAILLDTGTDGVVLPQAQADKVWGTTVRALTDKAGFALSTAGVQAIWDALTSALTTVGSIGKKLADWAVGTIDTYTGNTKQTGDAYAEAVAIHVHADTLADIHTDVGTAITQATNAASDALAAHTAVDLVHTDTDAILADTNELQTDWANGGRLDLLLDGASAPSAATVADAVWDEVLHTDHEVASSASVLLQSAGGAADPLLNAVPGAYGAGTAGYVLGTNLAAVYGATEKAAIDLLDDANGLINIHDTIDLIHTDADSLLTNVGDLHTDVGTAITAIGDVHATDLPALKTVVDNIHDTDLPAVKTDTTAILLDTGTDGVVVNTHTATSKSEINAEIVDVLGTDTLAELGVAAPSATPTIKQALMLLYMALRNETNTTASLLSVKNDAGTVVCRATLSDDGTTFVKAEFISG